MVDKTLKNTSHILIDYKHQMVEVRLSMRVYRDGKYFLAECPELKLIDQGSTSREAVENLFQMSQASIMEAVLTGNIEGMLKELGFQPGKLALDNRRLFNQKIEESADFLPMNVDMPIPKSDECFATL
ncbi:MAG: hypothetical protein ABIG42_06465 [bacterium]